MAGQEPGRAQGPVERQSQEAMPVVVLQLLQELVVQQEPQPQEPVRLVQALGRRPAELPHHHHPAQQALAQVLPHHQLVAEVQVQAQARVAWAQRGRRQQHPQQGQEQQVMPLQLVLVVVLPVQLEELQPVLQVVQLAATRQLAPRPAQFVGPGGVAHQVPEDWTLVPGPQQHDAAPVEAVGVVVSCPHGNSPSTEPSVHSLQL